MEKHIELGRFPDLYVIICSNVIAGENTKVKNPVFNSDFSDLSLILDEELDCLLSSFLISLSK